MLDTALLAACRLRRHQQEEEQLAPAEDEEEEEDEEESEYETDSEEEGFGRALLKPVFVPKVGLKRGAKCPTLASHKPEDSEGCTDLTRRVELPGIQ